MFVNNNKYPQAFFFLHSSNFLKIAHMDIKLGTHAKYIVSTTANCLRQNFLLHFSNLLTVTHIEIKLGTRDEYHMVSMTTTCCLNKKNSNRQFSLKFLLCSSNLLTVPPHMEMKLGTHAYYIVSMTYCLNNNEYPQAHFFKVTSLLFKLATYARRWNLVHMITSLPSHLTTNSLTFLQKFYATTVAGQKT